MFESLLPAAAVSARKKQTASSLPTRSRWTPSGRGWKLHQKCTSLRWSSCNRRGKTLSNSRLLHAFRLACCCSASVPFCLYDKYDKLSMLCMVRSSAIHCRSFAHCHHPSIRQKRNMLAMTRCRCSSSLKHSMLSTQLRSSK